jgi:hypothetical protein
MTEDDETYYEDFRTAARWRVRLATREVNSRDNASLTGSPTVGDLTGIDARVMSRDDYLNLVDRLRGGTRAGRRTEEISNQLRQERNRLAREAFERGMQNRRD